MVARSVRCRAGRSRAPDGEEVEAPAQPLQHLWGCQHLHPCCGKLERKRQAVETAADLGDGIVGFEVSLQRPRPLGKEGDGLGLRQRRYGIAPLAGQLQRFAAGDQELDRGSRSQEPGQTGCCVDDLLEVVQDQERLPVGEMAGEVVLDAQHPGDGRLDEVRLAHRGERNPADAIGEFIDRGVGDLQREPRLAAAAGTDQRDQTMLPE